MSWKARNASLRNPSSRLLGTPVNPIMICTESINQASVALIKSLSHLDVQGLCPPAVRARGTDLGGFTPDYHLPTLRGDVDDFATEQRASFTFARGQQNRVR